MLFVVSLLVILIAHYVPVQAFDAPSCIAGKHVTGLKFGTSNEDHVRFKLDMHPLEEVFSICGWIKRIPHSAPYQYWFGYSSTAVNNEILLRDDGIYWI